MQNNILGKDLALVTERLLLRPLKLEDVSDVFDYASNSNIATYTVWEVHETIHESEQFVKSILNQYEKTEMAAYGIELKKERKIVGTCGFITYDKHNHKAELAYALSPKYWGKGLAIEAAKAWVKYGFEELGLNRIEAGCHAGNFSSEKVMKRLGMRYEGTLRKDMFVKGKYRDTKVYAILKEDYKEEV